MIDTVKIVSPPLSQAVISACESGLSKYMQVNPEGHIEYQITRGSLEGTYDHRVSVRLDTRDDVQEVDADLYASSSSRLTIEGSVHKALIGHNVVGGPLDPVSCLRWLVADVARRLAVELPDGVLWEVARIDESSAYLLPCPSAISDYLWGLNQCQFPRRSVSRYGRHGIMVSGTTTTVKLYHKGPEFTKHDVQRLRSVGWDGVTEMQVLADRILRVEVEIKGKALKRDFGVRPTVAELTRCYLEKIHDTELNKMLKSAESELEVVCKTLDVSRRLEMVYPGVAGRHLFADWLALAALGEEQYRKQTSKTSWYRVADKLKSAAVSWLASDVHISHHSSVPDGFMPIRSNNLRLTEVSPVVLSLTEQYALLV